MHDLNDFVLLWDIICCGHSFCLKSTKQILMTQEERGGIVETYSSGVKTTLKVRITPMQTTRLIRKWSGF